MRLRVDHETRYTYDAPVSYGLQQVRMRPKDSRGQKVLDWTITVEGGATELCYDDHNGNRVDLIGIEPGRTETSIRCVGLVENTEGDGVLGKHQGFLPLWHFKRSSPLTQGGEGVRKLVAGLGDCDIAQVSTGHALSAAILDTVGYEGGNTHSGTLGEIHHIHLYGRTVEFGGPGQAGLLGLFGNNQVVFQGFALGLALYFPVHQDAQVRFIRIKYILGSPFANWHHALETDIAGDKCPHEDQDKGKVQDQNRPLIPFQQVVPADIPDKINDKENHDGLEPPGVIYPDSGGFRTVPALDKGTECHGHGHYQE